MEWSRIVLHQFSGTARLVHSIKFEEIKFDFFCIILFQISCPHLNTGGSPTTTQLLGGCLHYAGSRCKFSCPNNYRLVGPDTLTCLDRGVWSSSLPSCIRIESFCPPLSQPSSGQVESRCTSTGIAIGTRCQFTCQAGYDLIGSAVLECVSPGQWSATVPICQQRQGCTAINVANAQPVIGNGCTLNSVPIGSACSISCAAGYRLIGQSNQFCLSTGQWSSTMPTCAVIVPGCNPFQVPNAEIIGNGCMTTTSVPIGTSCLVRCFNGYVLTGDSQLICLATTQWSAPPPSCQLGSIGCLPLSINNALISGFGCVGGARVAADSTCIVSCLSGYTLSGISTLICLRNNNWNNPYPTCVLSPVSCPALVASYPLRSNGTCQQSTPGARCVFVCAAGFVLQGQGQLSCQSNGQWSAPMPSCVEVGCNTLRAPFGGVFVAECNSGICPFYCPTTPGQACRLLCGDGFQLIGTDSRLYCNANTYQWQPQPLPTCEIISQPG